MDIRTHLEPGDIGAVVKLHGSLYASEYGLSHRFETDAATRLAEIVERGFPQPSELALIAHDGEALQGCIFLTDEGEGVGRVRWFLLAPEARGQGLGRRLVQALMEHARAHRYERLELFTFDELKAAAHLYREAGFAVTSTEQSDRWGRPLTMQRYETAISSTTASSTSDGATATPSPGP